MSQALYELYALTQHMMDEAELSQDINPEMLATVAEWRQTLQSILQSIESVAPEIKFQYIPYRDAKILCT